MMHEARGGFWNHLTGHVVYAFWVRLLILDLVRAKFDKKFRLNFQFRLYLGFQFLGSVQSQT